MVMRDTLHLFSLILCFASFVLLNSEMPIFYSVIARGDNVLCEHSVASGELGQYSLMISDCACDCACDCVCIHVILDI
jgi:hypothetical protein